MEPRPSTRLTLDEQLEIEHDRRRRVTAALLYGAEARPATVPPRPWSPLIAGVTVALFIALAVALGTLIRTSLPGAQPAIRPTPTISAPPTR